MLIFHGDNQSASRSAFLVRKNADLAKNLNALDFSGPDLLLSDLVNSLQTVSLFGQQNLVIIEDFFSLKKTGREKEQIVKYLSDQADRPILIWESKNVSLQLKKFPPSAVFRFDLPKKLYDFLDTFSLTDLHSALQNTEPQVVLFLLAKQLHGLISVSAGSPTGLPDWKTAKLKRQAEKFSPSRLLELHHRLLELDYRQKNSLSAFDFAAALELWAVQALN